MTGLFGIMSGRTVLVTGASGGLGREIAVGLCKAGARVVLLGRKKDGLDKTLSLVPDAAMARVAVADITNEENIAIVAQEMRDVGWAPDTIVNNAGIVDRAPLENTQTESFENVLRTNLTAAMFIIRTFAPDLRASGNGRVLNVSSILGLVGNSNAAAYVSSKHGIIGLTRALCSELGRSGVTINALCPGYTRTDLNQTLQDDPKFNAMVMERTALARWGDVKDFVGPAIFLCSDLSSYMTGQVLVVDGGLIASL